VAADVRTAGAVGFYVVAAVLAFVDAATVEIAVVASVALGWIVGRIWVVGLVLLLPLLALPFNESNAEGETLLAYVIVLGVPGSAGLIAIGYLLGKFFAHRV
jgi:hypothetical protein